MDVFSLTSVLFILTTLITVWLFYRATQNSRVVIGFVFGLMILHGVLSWFEFYLDFEAVPSRPFLLLPLSIGLILFTFFSARGKVLIKSIDLKLIVWLSVIRIPVELVLHQLFLDGFIPETMTFEGRNFDILSGITAPIIAWFAFKKGEVNKTVLLIWNTIALLLLLQVVGTAIVSFPSPLQIDAFDQPNVGVLYFPFVWLPSVIVPIVAFSHVVIYYRLLRIVNN